MIGVKFPNMVEGVKAASQCQLLTVRTGAGWQPGNPAWGLIGPNNLGNPGGPGSPGG